MFYKKMIGPTRFYNNYFLYDMQKEQQTLYIDDFYHILINSKSYQDSLSKCTTVLKTFNLYNNTHKRFPPTLFFLHNMTSLLGKDAEGKS